MAADRPLRKYDVELRDLGLEIVNVLHECDDPGEDRASIVATRIWNALFGYAATIPVEKRIAALQADNLELTTANARVCGERDTAQRWVREARADRTRDVIKELAWATTNPQHIGGRISYLSSRLAAEEVRAAEGLPAGVPTSRELLQLLRKAYRHWGAPSIAAGEDRGPVAADRARTREAIRALLVELDGRIIDPLATSEVSHG